MSGFVRALNEVKLRRRVLYSRLVTWAVVMRDLRLKTSVVETKGLVAGVFKGLNEDAEVVVNLVPSKVRMSGFVRALNEVKLRRRVLYSRLVTWAVVMLLVLLVLSFLTAGDLRLKTSVVETKGLVAGVFKEGSRTT
jgi:predicted transcriptional regulator with HTH domain